MDEGCLAGDAAVARRPEEVRLQLDGREACRALGKGREAAVAGGGVRERDDGAGVEELVRREVVGADVERGRDAAVLRTQDLEADEAGEAAVADPRELLAVYLPAASPGTEQSSRAR